MTIIFDIPARTSASRGISRLNLSVSDWSKRFRFKKIIFQVLKLVIRWLTGHHSNFVSFIKKRFANLQGLLSDFSAV